MRVEITVTMYFIMKRCPLSFDPGGKESLLLVFLALVMGFSQFNEVHCFTATSEETWQRRLEFPEARHARNRNVVVVARTTSSLSKFTFPEYKTSELISGQTDHVKDDLLQFKPDDFIRHSEHHAIKSLSALFNTGRKLRNKSISSDFAADISLTKREFKSESQRTKGIKDGDKVTVRGREEKLDSSVGNKPSSIHEVNFQEGKYLILNEGSIGDRQLDKREAGREPPSLAEKSALSAEDLPTTNLSINASSKGDEQISPSAVPQSTSTTLQTTTKPKSSSSSTPSTVQQHINTLPQQTSSRTSSTVHPQQRPKPSTVKKEIVQIHTSHVQGTVSEEIPTTDAAVEESNASCDGAQCYASRLPYHWTTDASWALASMVFLISLLTFFVLYTGLWKKRNPMSYPLDSSVPPNPNPKINIADLLKTRLAMIPRHLRSKRQAHRKRMNGRRYEELPLHQPNGTCNEEELDYFEDDDEDDLYLRDEHTV